MRAAALLTKHIMLFDHYDSLYFIASLMAISVVAQLVQVPNCVRSTKLE